jgi:HPt (histidine-containing phosphotransfer) domain-containing protein
MAAGMDDYISKPISAQTLSDILEKWTSSPKRLTLEPIIPGAPKTYQDVGQVDLTVFNRAGLLERLMDDENFAQIVINGYLQEVPRRVNSLDEAIKTNDAATIELEAHTIKSIAANVCGEALRRIAYELEKAGRSGDLQNVGTQFAELQEQVQRLNAAIITAL